MYPEVNCKVYKFQEKGLVSPGTEHLHDMLRQVVVCLRKEQPHLANYLLFSLRPLKHDHEAYPGQIEPKD
jgi:hypothetical protein